MLDNVHLGVILEKNLNHRIRLADMDRWEQIERGNEVGAAFNEGQYAMAGDILKYLRSNIPEVELEKWIVKTIARYNIGGGGRCPSDSKHRTAFYGGIVDIAKDVLKLLREKMLCISGGAPE